MTARTKRIRWPVATLLVGVALAGGATAGYALTRPPNHDYGTVPAAGSLRSAGSPTTVGAGPTAAGAQPAASHSSQSGQSGSLAVGVVAAPARLRIPAIGVDAPVQPTGVAVGGQLAIPSDPARIGWWAGGGFPGEQDGAVILVGHIDSAASGPGALYRLADVRPGDDVTVAAGGRSYQYRVVALRAYPKSSLPVAAVFGQQVSARLVIVSCGGPFDASTGHYLDNIVAYALPVSSG